MRNALFPCLKNSGDLSENLLHPTPSASRDEEKVTAGVKTAGDKGRFRRRQSQEGR